MYEFIRVYSEPVAMSQRALSSRLSVSHLSHTQHNQICLFIVEITAFLLPVDVHRVTKLTLDVNKLF